MKVIHRKHYYLWMENLAIGVILFTMMLFNKYMITLWISTIVFVLFLALLWKNTQIILKYIIIIFGSLEFVGGGLLCEIFPQYLREIDSFTSYIGAMQPLLFFYWLMFSIIWGLDGKFARICQRHIRGTKIVVRNSNINRILYRYGFFLVFFYNLILFALVLRNPAFLYGINRFDYSKRYLSELASKMAIFPPLLCFLIVTVFWRHKDIPLSKIIKRLIIAYLPYVLYGIWTGHKFGLFIEAIFCILMILYEDVQINGRKIFKIILYVVLAVLILYLFLFIYYTAQGATLTEGLALISNRIVVQGELWWKIFSMSSDGEMHLNTWHDEVQAVISSITSNGTVKEYGVYHLMNLAGASRIVQEFLEQGIRYTAQGIEIPYYCFGYLALFIVPLVISPLFVIITNLYVHTAKKGLIIAPMVYLRILLLYNACFRQGDYFLFFSFTMLVFYFALFTSVLFRYGNHRKRI